MATLYGWAGTFLDVDLTKGKVEKKPVSPEFAEKYIGGIGFNAVRPSQPAWKREAANLGEKKAALKVGANLSRLPRLPLPVSMFI